MTAVEPTESELVEAYVNARHEQLAAWVAREPLQGTALFAAALITPERSSLDRALAAHPTTVDLHVCLMEQALDLSLSAAETDESDRVLSRIHSMVTPDLSTIGQALVHRCEAQVANDRHDTHQALQAARAALILIPPGSIFHLSLTCRVLIAAFNARDLRGTESLMADIEAQAADLPRIGFKIDRLRSGFDMFSGRWAAVADREGADPIWRFVALTELRRFSEAEQVLTSLRKPARDQPDARMMTDCLQVRLALRRGRYPAAHRLIQRIGAQTRPQTDTYDFLYRLVLNLALCEQRTAEARQLLDRLDPRRDRGDLGIEWMRWHLQIGDKATAAALLQESLRCWTPEAVAVELGHCPDLDVGTMVLLGNASSNAASTASPALPTIIPVDTTPSATAEGPLVGASAVMSQVRNLVATYAKLEQPVLVIGETGTGKDIIARLIHTQGVRPAAPFLALNCAALPDALAEAELFGHAKGSFTGALSDHAGLLAAAADGTLFLDEINSMSLRLQALLLRLLECGEYRPIGSTATLHARCRFLVASNRDLGDAVAAGTFREDLSYRLERLTISLPPLRERRGDIPLLVRHFLERSGPPGIAWTLGQDLLDALQAHGWPGNVRQLRNLVERLLALRGDRIRFTLADCPELVQRPRHARAAVPATSVQTVRALDIHIPGPPAARRRRQAIMAMFDQQAHVYNQDIRERVGGSAATIASDLAALVAAGLLRRVVTSGNHRTSFHVRADGSASGTGRSP